MVIKCNDCSGYLGNPLGARDQEARFGVNMRAHNPTNKEPKGTYWRCTICGTERAKAGGSDDSNSKKKKGK